MNATEEIHQIVIDRRPLWIVIFDRLRRGIFLAVLFALFVVFAFREGPADLSPQAYKVLCLFVFCVALWTTNLIPLSITSLFAIAAIPLMGIMKASQAYAYFGNKAVFFILGAFILSGAMIGCGLSARLSLWTLENWGKDSRSLVTSIYFFGAVGSCFMSEHAVAAMLFPIVLEIVNALKLSQKKSPLAKSMFFAMAWGCIIGGSATVLGGGRVPLAIEILEKSTQGASTIGLLQYSLLSLPMVFLLLVCGLAILYFLFPPETSDVSQARAVLHQKSRSMGRMTLREKGIAAVMAVTLVLWFGFGETLGIANIAIISIVALFSFNLATWNMVEEHVNWAIILMYGGAICLGEVMADSGAALWLARKLFEGFIHSAPVFLVAIAVLSLILTTFMSNSAVIAILLPPALSLCAEYGINPAVAAMTVILPSNFAFILPIATPASALAYSSKFISLNEMVRSGLWMGLLGILSYVFTLWAYWSFIGFF
ncbi:MAG: DASS family sodium-coupled anion symporter [Nitrospinae bacterium]|nr:DASS family sodium-coupled anion symporter [Nitrospinota bacterium]